MTREENLIYRRSCPYDAMGDYSILMEENQDRVKNLEEKRNRTEPEKKRVCRKPFLLPFTWIPVRCHLAARSLRAERWLLW